MNASPNLEAASPAPSSSEGIECSWYAVRCLFSHADRASEGDAHLYEERTTLWRAHSFDEAFGLAEDEAASYAAHEKCVFIQATDAFHLFQKDSIGHGSEIWSQVCESGMPAEAYIETFCATPRDRLQ